MKTPEAATHRGSRGCSVAALAVCARARALGSVGGPFGIRWGRGGWLQVGTLEELCNPSLLRPEDLHGAPISMTVSHAARLRHAIDSARHAQKVR